MRRSRISQLFVLCLALIAGVLIWRLREGQAVARWLSGQAGSVEFVNLRRLADVIRPIHQPKAAPAPDEWLARYPESGQSLEQYLLSRVAPDHERFKTLYLQPLGEFSVGQRRIVEQLEEFLGIFFSRPVVRLPYLKLDCLPAIAKHQGSSKNRQLRTDYLLGKLLAPARPDDAIGVLGVTAADLWPGDGWSFVFGQALVSERVAVASLYRSGSSDESEESYLLALRRTLRTASHEVGHILGFSHCIAYECGMNGFNHRPESDRQPIGFCPECQAKLWWTCGAQPIIRSSALARFAETSGLRNEALFWHSQSRMWSTDIADQEASARRKAQYFLLGSAETD